jgi:hypothetical protein
MRAEVESTEEATRLHHLVLLHGRERARELVTDKLRPLVDIAAEVMADESQRIGISYTGFCLTTPTIQPGKRRAIGSRYGLNMAGCVPGGRFVRSGRQPPTPNRYILNSR